MAKGKRSAGSTRAASKTGRGRKRVDPRSRTQKFLLRFGWILPLGAVLVGGGILLMTYAFSSIPLPEDIKLASSAEVYDVNGKLIGTFSDEVTRFLVDKDDLLKKAPQLGEAVIAAEDRQFYEHNGISARGIVRAAWANITGGEVAQGGSTITQQYVKNAVLADPERTITRKVKEAILAIKLERKYDKDEILAFYLNTIYLGRGAYGFEAAARAYFDKHYDQLTLAETAYLAGIIPAPNAYQPDEDMKAARGRRDRVLDLMVGEGFITQDEADEAKEKKVKLAPSAKVEASKREQQAAYFLEWLRKNFLYSEYGDDLFKRGFKVYTTLDLEMQDLAEEAVATNLPNEEDPQAALVTMTPRGEVRAMVGGKDFTNTKKARGFSYATSEPGRQPGSSFKPFTLLAAVDDGVSLQSTFSGASPLNVDSNPACNNEDGTAWEVDNYGMASYGSLDLIAATASSVNTVYAQLIAEIGPERVAEVVADFGYNPKYGAEEIEAVCSLTLGGSLDVTPLEQARAFAGFAGRGNLPHVVPIRYIEDTNGNCVVKYLPRKGECEDNEVKKNQPEQVIDENSVDVTTTALESVVTSGSGTAAQIGRPVAGKTGTTQNNGNAWFAGYTPQLSTVVWVGYPLQPGLDGKFGSECGLKIKNEEKRLEKQAECAADDYIPEMRSCYDPNPDFCRVVQGLTGGVTGGSIPASIWHDYMIEAVADMEVVDFATPAVYPGEILNPAPPEPTGEPEPTEEPSEEPSEEPTEEPTAEPSPTVEPSSEPTDIPTGEPEPSPSPTGGGGGGGGDGEERRAVTADRRSRYVF